MLIIKQGNNHFELRFEENLKVLMEILFGNKFTLMKARHAQNSKTKLCKNNIVIFWGKYICGNKDRPISNFVYNYLTVADMDLYMIYCNFWQLLRRASYSSHPLWYVPGLMCLPKNVILSLSFTDLTLYYQLLYFQNSF